MASKVDIWNLALSNIGHRATLADPDELTAEANHCRRFYPIALRAALERYAWSFATRRVALAEVANDLEHWAFAYALPNLCIKARAVLLPESTDDKGHPFEIESASDGSLVLYTNVEDAVLRYTTLVEDTNKFTPTFVLYVACELGSMLVGPIPKDMKLKKTMFDLANYYLSLAESADANASESTSYADFVPAHLAARSS